jgi:hypothetical protein
VIQQLDTVVDLLFDAIVVFQAVLEADQAPVWVLTFYGTQSG